MPSLLPQIRVLKIQVHFYFSFNCNSSKCSGNNNFSSAQKSNSNKTFHINNRNILSNRSNFCLLHWNKGSSNIRSKLKDIFWTLDKFKPDLFSIVEANMFYKDPIKIPSYCRLHIKNTFTRTILLISDSINYIRIYDLEDPFISSIWIAITVSKNSKVLLGIYYRQWSLASELGLDNTGIKQNQ